MSPILEPRHAPGAAGAPNRSPSRPSPPTADGAPLRSPLDPGSMHRREDDAAAKAHSRDFADLPPGHIDEA
jgi:hypothetical protein